MEAFNQKRVALEKPTKENEALQKRKFNLNLAHDTSILALLNSLHYKQETVPHYAASLVFEIYQKSGGFYVRLTYNDEPISIS